MLPVSGAQLCVSCAYSCMWISLNFWRLKHRELAFSYWTESLGQKYLSKFNFSQKCCSLIYAFLLHSHAQVLLGRAMFKILSILLNHCMYRLSWTLLQVFCHNSVKYFSFKVSFCRKDFFFFFFTRGL